MKRIPNSVLFISALAALIITLIASDAMKRSRQKKAAEQIDAVEQQATSELEFVRAIGLEFVRTGGVLRWTNLANPPEHLREKAERLMQLYQEAQREITNNPK